MRGLRFKSRSHSSPVSRPEFSPARRSLGRPQNRNDKTVKRPLRILLSLSLAVSHVASDIATHAVDGRVKIC